MRCGRGQFNLTADRGCRDASGMVCGAPGLFFSPLKTVYPRWFLKNTIFLLSTTIYVFLQNIKKQSVQSSCVINNKGNQLMSTVVPIMLVQSAVF